MTRFRSGTKIAIILGNTCNRSRPPALAGPEFKANPYPSYARMRAEAPVFSITARMEGQIALATLLRLRPHLRLAGRPESLRWHQTLPLRGLEALPVSS